MQKFQARLVAAAVAAMALSPLGWTAAHAAPGDEPTSGPPYTAGTGNVALINKSATTALHITKLAGPATGGESNGLPGGPIDPANTPLAGVSYSIYQVPGVDLTTNAGWASATSYYDALASARAVAVKPENLKGTCVTGTDGTCNLTALPIGLYYVVETAAPAGYTRAADFLVTLPMTNPQNLSEWMYDVHVYPKNQSDRITKTVEDEGTQTVDDANGPAADHAIDYTLTSSITDGLDSLGMYILYDDLDSRLTFVGADVTVGGTTLARGTDYVVWTAPNSASAATSWNSGAVAGGPLVTIVMTDAGLALLKANESSDVITVIHTTMGGEGDGLVSNEASFIPNQAWWEQNVQPTNPNDPRDPGANPPGARPGIVSGQVVTKYGDLQIQKMDAKDSTMLPGAEFAVYRDADNDEACSPEEMVGDNRIGGVVTTDSAGLATFKGLQASNFYDNATQGDVTTYCLVETKAPAGYNLSAQPIAFTIVAADAGPVALTQLQVLNEKTNLGNSLPLTGGQGVAALSGIGLVLVGGGVAYYVLANRRRKSDV